MITLIFAALLLVVVQWVFTLRSLFCLALWVFVLSHNEFMNDLFTAFYDSICDTSQIKIFLLSKSEPAVKRFVDFYTRIASCYYICTCRRSKLGKYSFEDEVDLADLLVDESSEIE